MRSTTKLPLADAPDLHLSPHPTPEECTEVWSATASSWKDSLTLPEYLEEAQYLTTVPLARNGGRTMWILMDKELPPGQRQVLCSCESFRKRALISDAKGIVKEGIVHGIASVFCPPKYRGRGYGTRLMKELAQVLYEWQSEYGKKSIGSVLYSDIGGKYYGRLGWLPNPQNGHFVFPPVKMENSTARPVLEAGLGKLCLRDEAMIRKAMATPSPSTTQNRVVILPDLDHILWHIRKEDFATDHIFGKRVEVKGAIAGSPGKQVWAVWVRRYYRHPGDHSDKDKEMQDGENVLYILRLAMEGDETANRPHEGSQPPPRTDAYTEQAAALQAVLRAAQAEATEWRLDHVHLWEPSPLVRRLLGQSSLDATWVERHECSIASALWFTKDAPVWVNNEYYAWC
ncbi:hypothetical protein PG996_011626 [Apiospora saccharicola]|uniref:N-acetyltransferase domain-containing protein n=1 Tax=Apiospora saccharicola TaxID=335842 RepID=A0ABR1UFL1_9PEZI